MLTFGKVFQLMGQTQIDFAAELFRWHRRQQTDDQIGILFNELLAIGRHTLWQFAANILYGLANLVLGFLVLQFSFQSRHHQFAKHTLRCGSVFGFDGWRHRFHWMARCYMFAKAEAKNGANLFWRHIFDDRVHDVVGILLHDGNTFLLQFLIVKFGASFFQYSFDVFLCIAN